MKPLMDPDLMPNPLKLDLAEFDHQWRRARVYATYQGADYGKKVLEGKYPELEFMIVRVTDHTVHLAARHKAKP
jgi:hypothetical protein